MTTIVVLAALTLVFNPVRVLAIFMLLALLYFSPVATLATLSVLALLYYYYQKWRKL